jgi:hypothetical protein
MESTTRTRMRSALFADKNSADAGYQAALARGYKPEEINILMSDDTKKRFYSNSTQTVTTEKGDKSMEGLAIGGALGGTIIGAIGAIVALSTTIVVPGLGLVVAGPLAAALVGAGAGSISGGLLGALIGAGLPEDRATIYENGIKKGEIVISVPSRDKDDLLVQDWKSHGRDIY